MTKGGRIFAGILAIIGAGLFLLIAALNWVFNFWFGATTLAMTITAIAAIVAFICAILTFLDKTFACVILLLLGIFMVIQPLLIYTGILTEYYISEYLWFDAIMILLGGLIGTAVGAPRTNRRRRARRRRVA